MCIFCSLAGIGSGGPACTDLPQVTDPANDTTNGAAASSGALVVNAAPAFSLAQIVQQLRTQWGGSFEGTTLAWPGTGPIAYFIGGTPYPSGTGEIPYKTTMTALMFSRATLAFELWDDLIARNLTPASSAASAQIQFEYATQTYNGEGVLGTNGGTYSRAWYSSTGVNGYGTTNYNVSRSEIWLNSNWTSHNADSDMFFGGYGFQTYMHEIGHSLGLSHPGTYDAGNGGTITYANNAEYSLDNRQYTIMSYFGGYAPGAGWQQDGTQANWLYSSTPMLHDVAAIQAIYGADMTTRTGDTTYGFNVSLGVPDVFNFNIDTTPIVTVWDAGGNDTLDLSGYSTNQRIDLRAGTYSDVGGMLSNFAIAYNVTLENAVGGSGNDTIIGNDGNNSLRGRAGNDTIDGGFGFDTAVFSGVRAAYTLTDLGGNSVRVVGPDGTDVLSNIEQLRFDDQTVSWPMNSDLTATLTLIGATARIGASNGGGTAPASLTGIYLSSDSTVTTSDTLLTSYMTPALAQGGSSSGRLSLAFSGNLTPGTYYVAAIADSNGQIAETSDSNNASNAVAVVLGNNNTNVLSGTPSGDTILGLGGTDTLNGAAGADSLTGGAAADIFLFDGLALANATAAVPVFDRIMDYDQGGNGIFNPDEGDQIDLSALLATAFGGGQPIAALVRAVRDSIDSSSVLQVDTDGSANGARWTTIARLDGIAAGNTLNVIVTGSQPGGTNIVVQDDNTTTQVGNFSGDGHGDLLWRNTDGTVGVWLMNSGSVQAANDIAVVSADWHIAGIGDFSGDGKSDILWRNDDGTVGEWQLNGTAITAAGSIQQVSNDWHVVGTADFGGDGRSDILWRNDDGTVGLWHMNGTAASAANIMQVDNSWHVAGTGDFNGDAKADLLWRSDSGLLGIWTMNGSSVLSAENVAQVDPAWRIAGTGDFNGDGRSDILWRHDSGTVGLWTMNGASPTSAQSIMTVSLDWHIIGVGDYNGDSRADILWDNDDGTVGLWTMDGATAQSAQNISVVPHDWFSVAHHYDLV